MKIKDVLQRDPATHPLANQGQARIADTRDANAFQELRNELSTFVCEGQYADGIERILRSFLTDMSQTSQRGAWVSGFFGSGKSHLLKMLCHLWQDTPFPDGATARAIVPKLPDEIRALLKELDTAGKRTGGLLAAAGSLPSGTTDRVRLTILGVIFRAAGLPEQYSPAQFCLWLHSRGFYDRVKKSVEKGGREFERELSDLYVSPAIAKAVMDCDSAFASNETEARKTLRAQFAPLTTDITTAQFLSAAREALNLAGRNGRMPCTILILDEVQQYIGTSIDRSVLVSEVAEAVSKELSSQVIVVGAGQSALADVPLLARLLDRFTIRVTLSDTDVETVTRKVLLQKNAASVGDVKTLLNRHAGEISRQLQDTRIGERAEDREIIVDDYPLLPVRRRFWEQCFRQIDAPGTSSQLRSQLRILHDAIGRISDQSLGAVVPGDELFDALAPDMVNTGILPRELNERILRVGKDKGALARRISGLVFLIGKLKREGGADLGIRANAGHIADLLVTDLSTDNAKLRAEIEATLKHLVDAGDLMEIDGEYRIQTNAARQWDADYRARRSKLNGDEPEIQYQRTELLSAEAGRIVGTVKIQQGQAREHRSLLTSRENTPPTPDGSGIPIWIRDGWSGSQKEVLEAARKAGPESPIVYVFTPSFSTDELRQQIVDAQAAKQTLDAHGNPATAEEQDARQSMEGRQSRALAERDRLVREIAAAARVFQGGGSEVFGSDLGERITEAANAAAVRLFPQFKVADAPATAWENVLKRAKAGAEHPFQPVGHNDATEKHPVCQQVLSTIGSGKAGNKIRSELCSSPYGWPQDSIDAALIALHRSQHITAMLNGTPVVAGQLDQNRIAKSEFHVEHETLSVQDRLKIRGLFNKLGMTCKAGEETLRASEFLEKLIELAKWTGGEPPLPPLPDIKDIEDLRTKVGNAQLIAIKDRAAELESKIALWSKTKDLIEKRLLPWAIVSRMARSANNMPEAQPLLTQFHAIKQNRLLLDGSDPVAPIRVPLATLLRDACNRMHNGYSQEYQSAIKTLEGNELWQKLNDEDRSSILRTVGLAALPKPDLATDDSLNLHLENHPLISQQTEIDAFPGRIQSALERAAKLLEPQAQMFRPERATLRADADVEAWLGRQRSALSEAIKRGPVVIN